MSARACAAAALRDVATYFTKEEGQVAVSERTSENCLIHFSLLSYRDLFSNRLIESVVSLYPVDTVAKANW